MERKTKNKTGIVSQIVIKCCLCCLWCLEKCLKFLNKNAYIEIAIFGYNFCTAARRAFMTLVKNLARVVVLNFVTGFMMFVLKLLVVALAAIVAYYWIQQDDNLKHDLNYWGVLVFFIGIVAYFVANVVLDIYDMTIDTLFLCFAEDCAHNNGKVCLEGMGQ